MVDGLGMSVKFFLIVFFWKGYSYYKRES
jgi:hypothetical protein